MGNRQAAKVLGVNLKGRIGQKFCRHKNKRWFIDHSAKTIRGEVRLQICLDCGKCCGRELKQFEGDGWK